MRAAWYTKNGEAREVLVVGELPTPEPGPMEVRVKLATSGINPSDVKSRRSRPLNHERIVPHSDGAGTIDAVGSGVSSKRVGERVWVWNAQHKRAMGTACEYVVLPEAQAVTLPDTTDFHAGACLGIPALTAFQAVNLAGDIAGKTVLVIGASSAVGHYAAQFATIEGANVIGTVGSPEKAEHARAAGVKETINYKQEPVADRIREMTSGRGVDAIIDMDFSTTIKLATDGVLAPHGTFVCYGSNDRGHIPVPYFFLVPNSISLRFFIVYELTQQQRRTALDTLSELLAANRLRHAIGKRFGLDDIAASHEAVEGGSVVGNVVIDLA